MKKIRRQIFTIITLLLGFSFLIPLFSHAQTGSPVYFFVDPNYETDGHKQEEIVFLYSSQKAHLYIEKSYYNNLSAEKVGMLQNIGNVFDTKVYDSVRNIFGSEWNPGVDNDPKITIYFTDMPTQFNGYVRLIDESISQFATDSNKREMIYINANLLSDEILPAVLAHEFQHLINYNQKEKTLGVKEERWLNEALSEYATTLINDDGSVGYLTRRLSSFINSSNDSLVVWNSETGDYGSVSMFAHYLADIYGDALIYNIAHGSFVGTQSVTSALEKAGVKKDFSQVYTDWTTALFLNQNFDNNQVYAYKNPVLNFLNLRISAKSTFNITDTNLVETSIALQDFSPQWYRFIPSKYDLQNLKFLNIKFETLNRQDTFKISVITTSITGNIAVDTYTLSGGVGALNIPDFNKNVSSVVLIPSSHTNLSGFDNSENKFRVISIEASLSSNSHSLKDGDLIKTTGDNKVYVIKGSTKRWIPSAEIFNGYGHLKWENIIEVSESILNTYAESRLIKFAQDYRVYQVSSDGRIKQWLNMTAAQFISSGRNWSQVYEINQSEFNSYFNGAQITSN